VLVLRIAMDGHGHDVMVYGPKRLDDDPDVAAFLRVWTRVLALVPPPGPEVTARPVDSTASLAA
jgi:hypothetical protein